MADYIYLQSNPKFGRNYGVGGERAEVEQSTERGRDGTNRAVFGLVANPDADSNRWFQGLADLFICVLRSDLGGNWTESCFKMFRPLSRGLHQFFNYALLSTTLPNFTQYVDIHTRDTKKPGLAVCQHKGGLQLITPPPAWPLRPQPGYSPPHLHPCGEGDTYHEEGDRTVV